MTQQINGQLGDWASKYAKAKPIDVSKKTACLELFKQGMGFRKSAKTLGLRPYTVRDWQRRFKAGDESWASRDGRKFARHAEAKDLINYRHEIEAFIPGRGADPVRDGSGIRSEQPLRGREDPVAGGAEQAVAIPLYCADGAYERILAGGPGKKKEVAAVQSLTADENDQGTAQRLHSVVQHRQDSEEALIPVARSVQGSISRQIPASNGNHRVSHEPRRKP